MDKTILIKKLDELEKTQKEFWNISRQTGNFLNMLVKMTDAKNVFEIGTSNGYSGLWLLEGLYSTHGHLTTVEFYDKRQSVAKENFNLCGFEGLYTTLLGDACEILRELTDETKYDLVFIDANKREYIDYYKLIKPHLSENAIIAADNVNSHREKVQPFLDSIMEDKEFQTEILDFPGGLSLSYRKNS